MFPEEQEQPPQWAGVCVNKVRTENQRKFGGAGLFEVKVADKAESAESASGGKKKSPGVLVSWTQKSAWQDWATLSEGCYMLRTNVLDWSDADLWEAYIQLTEAEEAFRIAKNDLSLRPVWHQKTDRVESHVFVCFLAYVLWKTLGLMAKRSGLGDEPRRIFDCLSEIDMVDVVLPTRLGEIRRTCITSPDGYQRILLQRLGLSLPRQLTQK